MRRGKVYQSIVDAVGKERLREPFTSKDFRSVCLGWAEGTYEAFLFKHRKGNPGGNSELFVRVGKGRFRLI
jgi:hypothetical protein